MPLARYTAVPLFVATIVCAIVGTSFAEEHAPILTMLPGIVEPSQSVSISAPLDGTLMRLDVREGETVAMGKILAVMDDRVAREAVRAAEAAASREASIALAEAQLAMARQYFHRVQHAHQLEAASELEFETARSEYQQAEASLQDAIAQQQVAAAQLTLEQARLETHHVAAPFSGRVLKIEGRVGQALGQSDELLTLANLRKLRVELHVPVAWFGKLTPGAHYHLAAARPVNTTLIARLDTCDPVISAVTDTFRCVFEIDNSDRRLPAGFTVRLRRPGLPSEASQLSSSSAVRHLDEQPQEATF